MQRRPPFSRDASRAALNDMLKCQDKVFKRLGLTYFLDEGTLLGAVRHGGWVPWDDTGDMDLGLLTTELGLRELGGKKSEQAYAMVDLLDRTSSEMCGNFVLWRDSWWSRNIGPLYGHTTAYGLGRVAMRVYSYTAPFVYIDLRDYETLTLPNGRQQLYDAHFAANNDTAWLDMHQVLPTVPCQFEDFTVECPRNVSYTLERTYGMDWRIPKRHFITRNIEESNKGF